MIRDPRRVVPEDKGSVPLPGPAVFELICVSAAFAVLRAAMRRDI